MPDELPWDLTGVGPMTCHVSGGAGWIGGRGRIFAGADVVIGDGGVLPRIDLIYASPLGESDVELLVVVGEEATEPVVPPRPEGVTTLWGVRVPAAVTAESGGIETNPTWPYARIDCRT